MIIPVLPQLHSRQQWIDFCRRETPYCYVSQPQCLIDMQTTFLQLTLLDENSQGKQAVKYSLGSRVSVEPVWNLIKACDWQLDKIIAGLESMDFSSNVRDNSLLKAHTEVTARKFHSKERSLIAPAPLGRLSPLLDEPRIWCANATARLLANKQFRQFRNGPDNQHRLDANSLLLEIIEAPGSWLGERIDGKLHILKKASGRVSNYASLLPDFRPPAPQLIQRRPPLARL